MTEEFVIKGLEELESYKKTDIIKMYARTLYNLRRIVDNLNLWKCPKCGNWSEPNCVCSECLYDPSILEKEDFVQ